jgi:hypothetical protein
MDSFWRLCIAASFSCGLCGCYASGADPQVPSAESAAPSAQQPTKPRAEPEPPSVEPSKPDINLGRQPVEPNSPPAQSVEKPNKLQDFVQEVLQKIQKVSFDENIEYCGYIVSTPDGSLKAVGPKRGSVVGCRTPLVYKPEAILVSFHTHGAFDPRMLTEIPSTLDFDAVAMERVVAYIATPGGRLWHLDFESATARLIICSPKDCLPRQKSAPKALDYSVPDTLTRSQVVEIERKTSTPPSLRR